MTPSSPALGNHETPDESAECVARYATPRSFERKTYGPELAQIGDQMLGTPFMPHQHQIVNTAMEVDPLTGKLAYGFVIVILPRRGGKTTIEDTIAIHRALAFPSITGLRQTIIYTAQTAQDGYDVWLEQVENLERIARLDGKFKTRKGNNTPKMTWANGSVYRPLSVTKKSGHSKTIDAALLDEVWAHEDNSLEGGISPTMGTREQPQMWLFSRAPERTSRYLKPKMKLGRQLALDQNTTSGIAYFEFGANREDPDFDRTSPVTWRKAHPAVGRTITIEFLRLEQLKMDADPDLGPEEFDKNYLNLEPDEEAQAWDLFSQQKWDDSKHYVNDLDHSYVESEPGLSIDVTPQRDFASIGFAGRRTDGRWHGEVLAHRRGVRWVVAELIQICDERGLPKKVAIDGAGAANDFKADLEDAGFEVFIMSARDAGAAAGLLFDAVEEDDFRHLGQPELDAAAGAVIKRNIGQAWAFNRLTAAVPISPVVAVGNAMWASVTVPPARSNDELMDGVH